MIHEFSRRFALETIGAEPRRVSIEASADERVALAGRFDLASLGTLTATAILRMSAAGVEASGRLVALAVQRCVVTADAVPVQIEEAFALRFVDPDLLIGGSDEIELSDEDCDLIAIEGGAIDLGEAVAQTLGLALDPFPRCNAERARDEERKWVAGEDAGPFAGLKGMLGG